MSRITRMIVGGAGIMLAAASYLQVARLDAASPAASSAQAVSASKQAADVAPAPAVASRAVLDKYCITCHNDKRRVAELALDKADIEHVSAGAEVWEKVVRKLRTGAMPPTGMPRPDPAMYGSVASYLETELDRSSEAKPNPGVVTIHRLNRVEYSNAVRDLLALDVDGRSLLPADDSGYGFDNIADVLSVSPALLERYMSAAQKIGRLAIGDPAIRPDNAAFRLPISLDQGDRMSEDLPFGSRGGLAVRYNFPLDGDYVVRIHLQRHWENIIRGLGEANQLEVRLDGVRIKEFTVGGKFANVGRGGDPETAKAKQDYEFTADTGLEIRFPAKAGTRVVGVAFKPNSAEPEGVGPSRLPATSFSFAVQTYDIEMGIDRIEIAGPFNGKVPQDTPSRREIFVCRPTSSLDEEACATKILTRLARRAYRRPVTDADIQLLLRLYRTGQSSGGFESGIEWALERILVAPDFLFRVERDPVNAKPGVAYRVSDLDLASRLSFFLWSSSPDDQLLDLAARGRLKDPIVLEQQVKRMLANPRSKALMDNFGGQWVYLRNMPTQAPDPKQYPEFDDTLRQAFQQETALFLDSQLREDRNVTELLTANYTFVNERLAKFYGIPNVYGNHFRRVSLGDDTPRAGLLGQGTILTVTSYANRTSPVVRGKWLLDNLLGAPPPPPPPNVPSLKENGEGAQATSVRERLEQHRKNPVCASCHARMDPLGFALENFDGIGRYRSLSEGNTPVDASGVLPDGSKFDGAAEFRKALLKHQEQFVMTVTGKLMTYALGRGTEYYDMPSIRKVTRDAAANDYRWSSLILGIAKSMPFQMRMPHDPAAPTQITSSQTGRTQ